MELKIPLPIEDLIQRLERIELKLDNLQVHPAHNTQSEKPLLTIDEALELIPWYKTKNSVYHAIPLLKEAGICKRVGRHLIFNREKLLAWVNDKACENINIIENLQTSANRRK